MEDLTRLRLFLAKSNNGTALLFTGAGFSFGAKNINNAIPKDAISLSKAICGLCEIEEDDDLYYSSEYCLENKPTYDLIKLLKNEYTIKDVAEHHKIISKKSWRRVYTTNYDQVFEIASSQSGKVCESLTISSDPNDFKQKGQIVHLNGSIDQLGENALSSDFKLTDSSYISPDTIINSKWKNKLQLDVEFASSIFFVGYSMYDLDIKRIIKSDPILKEKTFFIVKPGENKKEIFKLSKFGTVLDIGVEHFSELLEVLVPDVDEFSYDQLESFEKSKPTLSDSSDIDDDEIINLFVKGELNEDYIYQSVSKRNNYLVKRFEIDKNAEIIAQGGNILLTGDIASGKTIYLKQLSSILTHEGRDVFVLKNEDGDAQNDISIIDGLTELPIFLIDNAFRHEDLIRSIYSKFGDRASFVIAGRTDFIERTKIKLAQIGLQFIEENIDYLNSEELHDLNKLCNHIGFWGDKNFWLNDRKESYLERDCEGTFSGILLKYFDSEYIKSIYENVLSELKNKGNPDRDVIFTVVLLGILPFNPTKHLISDLCNTNKIFDPGFKDSTLVKMLLSFDNRHIEITSGILSKYLLNKFFSGREIVEKILFLVAFFNDNKFESTINNSVFKELLRFKNINFMLPDDGRGVNLKKFFNDLKNILPWMEKSPHFWLQYGMANMFIGDYPIAKQYFDNAYGSARNDQNYDTKYIDNQMARWHLEYGLKVNDKKHSFEHLYNAYKILISQDIDYYFCKQAILFEGYYTEIYPIFKKGEKVEFEKFCKNIIKKFSKQKGYIEQHNGAYVIECERMFVKIINDIELNRKR